MMRITPAASQKKAFPLAGTLNRLSLSESHTNLVISGQLQKTLRVTFGYLQTSLNSLILSKSAIGVSRETKHEQYSGSGKEKGSTVNATLWDYSDGSALDFLRCSILSLRPQASSTHDEKLTVGLSSFSRSTLASIWSISSWGKRIPFVADLLFFALVAIKRSPLSVMTPYTNLERKKRVDVPQHLALMCPNTLLAHGVKKATPQSATNTSEASNHNVNEAYTMALQHSTQTRPKFQYLFLAVCRSDLNAKPHRESVTAHSEQDARRSLAGQFVLSFAGRIPAQGVCNA